MKAIKRLFTGLIFFLLLYDSSGQNRGWQGPIRQRIFEAKLAEIKKSLNLDQPTLDRFRPVYAAYEKELASINFRDQGAFMQVNPDSLSPEEAEKMIMAQISQTRKMVDLREKYYTRFKTVLSPQQIIKLYQTEAAIRRKVMNEIRRRFGNRFNPE